MHWSNRNDAADPAHTRFGRRRSLCSALLNVVGRLTSRPEPRDQWDDLGRKDAASRVMWIDRDVEMCREALVAAKAEGPAAVMQACGRIDEYFAEKAHFAKQGFVRDNLLHFRAASRALVKEQCEATAAVVEADHDCRSMTVRNAAKEVREMVAAGLEWLGVAGEPTPISVFPKKMRAGQDLTA